MSHSLRRLAHVVGVDQGAYDVARWGGPPWPGLASIGRLFTTLDDSERLSLARLSAELPTLPDLTVGGRVERVEIAPGGGSASATVRVDGSPGAVWWTTITTELAGSVFVLADRAGAGAGQAFDQQIGLWPGRHTVRVARTGLTSAGMWGSTVQVGTIDVPPARSAPPPPPPPPVRPVITVTQELAGTMATYTVTGHGFLPDQPATRDGITVRRVDVHSLNWWHEWTSSDSGGAISIRVGPLDISTALTPNFHTLVRSIRFSATDRRKDPDSFAHNDPLWSEAVGFDYGP